MLYTYVTGKEKLSSTPSLHRSASRESSLCLFTHTLQNKSH